MIATTEGKHPGSGKDITNDAVSERHDKTHNQSTDWRGMEEPMNGIGWGETLRLILLGTLVAGVGILPASPLHAALLAYIYPPDKNVLVNRSFEPHDFSAVTSGGTITVTLDVINNEGVALRGFYCSDQVPNGWVVNTSGVSVSGLAVADYTYERGNADEIYASFSPHRWSLEIPQGDGAFSPPHPIPGSGGTARIVYTMVVSDGAGSDYSLGHEAWAGWLETTPTGTAVFGYEDVIPTSTPTPTDTTTVTSTPTDTPVPTGTPTVTPAPTPKSTSTPTPTSKITPYLPLILKE